MTIFLTKLAAIFGMIGGGASLAYAVYAYFMYFAKFGAFGSTSDMTSAMTLFAVCGAIFVASEVYDQSR